jgi:hypothetical protein
MAIWLAKRTNSKFGRAPVSSITFKGIGPQQALMAGYVVVHLHVLTTQQQIAVQHHVNFRRPPIGAPL